MPESTTPPTVRFSFVGQLQERLTNEAERRMKALTENDLKAVIALVESLQLDVAIENVQAYDPVDNARNAGKNEAFMQVAEEMFARLMSKQQEGEEPQEGDE